MPEQVGHDNKQIPIYLCKHLPRFSLESVEDLVIDRGRSGHGYPKPIHTGPDKRKRSSYLNSFRAPPGSYIKPDYQFVTKFTNRFTHLNSKKCKKVKFFTRAEVLNVTFGGQSR